jgi:hypothetical protein
MVWTVDTETSLPSQIMFWYWLLVIEVVLFSIIFLKIAADAAWNWVSCPGPLSQLKTSSKQMRLSYHSSGTKHTPF